MPLKLIGPAEPPDTLRPDQFHVPSWLTVSILRQKSARTVRVPEHDPEPQLTATRSAPELTEIVFVPEKVTSYRSGG